MLHGLHNKPHNQPSSMAWFLDINQIIFCLECTRKQCSSREINSIPCSEYVEGNAWMWFLKKKSLCPKKKSLCPKGRWVQSKGRSCENISSVWEASLGSSAIWVKQSLNNTKVQQDSDKSNCTMSHIPKKSNSDILTQSNRGGKREKKKPNQTITHHLCSSGSQPLPEPPTHLRCL